MEQRDDVNSVQDYSNTLGVSYSPEEIAVQFGFEKAQAEMMFKMSGKDTMTTSEFLSAASMMLSQTEGSEEMLAQLKAAQETMDENRRQMLGKDYNRMIVSIKHESEGDSSFNAIGELIDKADDTFSDSNYFVGDSVMGKEMNDGFKKELNFVTLLTIIAIFIVVLFTFRSILSSAILVIVIQSAVYITTSFTVQTGFTINYIALILVQCILMGATIDYGILFTCNYIEERRSKDKKQAVGDAMNRSIKTILTSSLILIGCCLTTGLLMTQKAISQTTTMIAVGTAVAVFMVVFVLPVVLYFTDKLAIKQFGNKK